MSDWQPIETALKGANVNVLVWVPKVTGWDDDNVYIAYWSYGRWNPRDGDFDIPAPTHWMPLPPPPEA